MASAPEPAARPDYSGEASRPGRRGTELDQVAARASTGDPEALDRLLTLLRAPLASYCRARLDPTRGSRTSEDLAEAALRAVCAGLSHIPPGTPVLAFAHQIVRKDVSDEASSVESMPPAPHGPNHLRVGPGGGSSRPAAGRMRELLDGLPPFEREALILRVALNYSVVDTADALCCTPATVRRVQHHALDGLRGLLAGAAPSATP